MTESEQPDPAPSSEALPKDPGESKNSSESPKAPVPRRAEPGGDFRPGHGSTILAVVAVILALVALAGVGALGWSWYQLRGEQGRVAQLEGRVSALGGQVAALGNTAASERSVSELASRLKAFREAEDKRSAAMQQALQAVSARLVGADKSYREDEAASLMRLARARLELQSDPAAAAQALKLADQALAGVNDPALDPVRTALAKEIAALEAVPQPDVTGAYAQLDVLMGEVNTMPLAGEAPAPAPVPHTASSGFSWSGVAAAFKRAFGSLVVVRHGEPARPLLPPREAWFVRENVKLALGNAQLALLERNDTAWRASLDRAREWLRAWFQTSKPEVANAIATLTKLSALELSPKLPTLGAALSELGAVRAAKTPAQ